MRKIFFGLLILGLVFSLSCNGDTYQIPGFPEKIIDNTENWNDLLRSFIDEHFCMPIINELNFEGRTIGALFYQGKKSKRSVIVFVVINKEWERTVIGANYADELMKKVKERYSDNFTKEQAIEVLQPEIDKVVEGFMEFFKQ